MYSLRGWTGQSLCNCPGVHDTIRGVQVVTSFHPEDADDHLLVIASTNEPQEEGMPSKLRMQIPRSKAYFTGTGRCL